jgi:hypothetical protein
VTSACSADRSVGEVIVFAASMASERMRCRMSVTVESAPSATFAALVLDVQVRGVKTGRLILQVDRDRETRRVIGGGVDAETARKLVDELAQLRLVPVQVEKGGVGQQVVGYGNTANGIRHEVPP